MTLELRVLGRVPYADALTLMDELAEQRRTDAIGDTLLVLEHPHVYTLGRGGKAEHILFPAQALRAQGVDVVETSRGGDVTYHGPGQLVGYPILRLRREDVRWYVQCLERTMVSLAARHGIVAGPVRGLVGVWTGTGLEPAQAAAAEARERGEDALPAVRRALVANGARIAKLGAVGVHISRWITTHGFALNLTTDLSWFERIIPCGLQGLTATSIAALTGERPHVEDVAPFVAETLAGLLEEQP